MTKISSMTVLGLALGMMGGLGLAGCGDDDAMGTDAGPGAADASGGGGDAAGGAPTCEEYCTTYLDHCNDTLSEFSTMSECVSYCQTVAGWQPGIRGATSGNTIACRLYHAGGPAMSDPTTHCPHAGPSGEGVCGQPCDGYCELALRNCTGVNMLYADLPACMASCAMFPATGNGGDTSGDTVQCRIYHAGTPASENPAMHCPHAGPTGAGICVNMP